MHASEKKWRSVFEFFPAGISVVDNRHRVTASNVALSRILGLTEEGLLAGAYAGRRYFRADGSLMPADEFPSVRALKEHRAILDVVIGVEKEDGERIWTSVSATPEFVDGYAVTVTFDITDASVPRPNARLWPNGSSLRFKLVLIGVWEWQRRP